VSFNYRYDTKDMRTEQEVRTYIQRLTCEECGGEMKREGDELTSSSGYMQQTWYPHECDQCGWKVRVLASYPRMVYRTIEEGRDVDA
jgi:RNase P subunit RPR2